MSLSSILAQDLSSAAGLKQLNDFLATRSYADGYNPKQADASLFHAVPSNVDKESFPHVYRWYTHIASFGIQNFAGFPGAAPSVESKSAAAPAAKPTADDDDGFELSDSDSDEDVDLDAIAAKKKAEAAAREAKKKAEARSNVILAVKPYGSETDLGALEAEVRAITMKGLQWGESRREEIAYGVEKIIILCQVYDELVSVDELTEKIEDMEDCQSVDIVSFNKV